MSPEQLQACLALADRNAQIFQAQVELAKQQIQNNLEVMRLLCEDRKSIATMDERQSKKLVRQAERDRRILELWQGTRPGTRLTREMICERMGKEIDNGWVGRHLTSLVKRGLLANDFEKTGIPGFYPVTLGPKT